MCKKLILLFTKEKFREFLCREIGVSSEAFIILNYFSLFCFSSFCVRMPIIFCLLVGFLFKIEEYLLCKY